MIHIAIVDNDVDHVVRIKQYLEDYERESGEAFSVAVFSDGDNIVHSYRSEFDIILMDVEMKFMDGISAAREIRKIDSEVVIMFITATSQYAKDGYSVGAFDYLTKPLSYFTFSSSLARAISRARGRISRAVTIGIKGGIARLDVRDIYYIESRGHSMIYHTAMGEYESNATMKQTEERFRGMNFFRASKWYLVNLAHVDAILDNGVTLLGRTLTVSRTRKREFIEAVVAYWGQ